MAALNQEHIALVARHSEGIARLLRRSPIDPSTILVVIAHVESPVGKTLIAGGLVPASGRSSVVMPTSIEATPKFAEVLGLPEMKDLAAKHGAAPVVVFDRDGNVGITFEKFVSNQAGSIRRKNRRLIHSE